MRFGTFFECTLISLKSIIILIVFKMIQQNAWTVSANKYNVFTRIYKPFDVTNRFSKKIFSYPYSLYKNAKTKFVPLFPFGDSFLWWLLLGSYLVPSINLAYLFLFLATGTTWIHILKKEHKLVLIGCKSQYNVVYDKFSLSFFGQIFVVWIFFMLSSIHFNSIYQAIQC